MEQYLYLSLGDDLVAELPILFALLGFATALLITEQPKRLRALQFDLKLLAPRTEHRHVTAGVPPARAPFHEANSAGPLCTLTSFQLGSVESLCTRVLALLTK